MLENLEVNAHKEMATDLGAISSLGSILHYTRQVAMFLFQ